MHCHEVRKHTSEYVDHFLGDAERNRFVDHVAVCAECRDHLDATRRVVASLRALPAPMAPGDLFERTVVALDREAEPAMTIVTRRHFRLQPRFEGSLVQAGCQLLLNYEFNLIAYGVGLCISFVMFVGLLASIRPLLSLQPFNAPSSQVWYVDNRQATVLADSSVPDIYSLPRISHGDGLVQYATQFEPPDADDLVVIAEVTTDGRGSIVEVLNGPPDRRVVGELASALNRPRTFVPAYATSGRPVPARVVLGIYKVDIWG
jgi:anti-sigma factor RsiW